MLSQLNNSDSVVSLNNFSKFNPKVDFSSNKSYLTNAYGHNFEYYNDPKTEKNKKLRYILVAASTAIVVIGAFIGAMRSGKISLDKLRKAEEAVQKSTITESIQNIAMNFTNVKDDLWDRFACFLSDKFNFGILKSASTKLTDIYRGIFEKGITKRLSSVQSNIEKLVGDNKELSDLIQFKEFNFKKINSDMSSAFKSKRISSAIFSNEKGIKGALKSITSPLGNNTIASVVHENVNILPVEQLKEKGATQALLKEVEKYNSIQLKELFPKLRDINCGSAPTDVITAGIPLVGFAAALGISKDKKKNDSIMLNIGLPLIPTCLMPFVGLKFPILNGFRGLLAGFATGQIAKQSVKFADSMINKNKSDSNV